MASMIHTFIYIFTTLCLIYCSDNDSLCRNGPTYMSCFPNGSGYTEYKCNETSGIYTEHQLHRCQPDKTCKCFEQQTPQGLLEKCECVNKAERPAFPSTGVIRWNGTYQLRGAGRTYIPGEVSKDNLGRFLMKTTSIHDWKQGKEPVKNIEFEIIVPDVQNEAFMKYSGTNRSTKCKVDKVQNGGKLISIWQDDPRKYYYLLEETQVSKHIETHVWHQEIPHQGEEWKFTIHYNTKEKYAIPVAYNYVMRRGGSVVKSINLTYKYEPLNNIKNFELEKYCKNS